jgi:hypothetical protein
VLKHGIVHVVFVVDQVAMEQVFLRELRLFLANYFSTNAPYLLSSGASTKSLCEIVVQCTTNYPAAATK